MLQRRSPLPSGLPIDGVLSELRAALDTSAAAVLQAPPGAGKTTIVPLALLDAGWLAGQRIVMLEPRRLAARAAAHRMASLLSEAVGRTVGYRIRLDVRISAATRIEVVTEGVLTRMLLHDPTLEGYGIVIFDEYHERSLQADVGLALTLHTKRLVRPDLRTLVMSATLDGGQVSQHLGAAPVIVSEGREFPVETRYGPPPRPGHIAGTVVAAVRRALREADGDVLVFLPGAPEIHRTMALLATQPLPQGVFVAPLFGLLSQEEQDRAIAASPPGRRKVVLATSIAETSLTIEGVRTVIDSGLARTARFSPRIGMTRLHTVRVSRAAADQRRGRAGRIAPGICFRLWHEDDDGQLRSAAPPEILEGDLVPLALDLAAAGIVDPLALTWLDAPPAAAYSQATELLRQLAALDDGKRITDHGRRMAAWGMHPRLAHMIIRATGEGLGALACDLAALLGERDVLRGAAEAADTDIRLRLDLLRERDSSHSHSSALSGGMQRIRAQSARWRSLAGAGPKDYDRDAAGRVLALAYPDRVARRRSGATPRYLLRNGLEATLPAGDALSVQPFLVIGESDGKQPHARAFLVAPLSMADVEANFADQIHTQDRVEWSDEAGLVRARRERRLGAIVLAERMIDEPDREAVATAIASAERRRGLTMLPWSEGARRLRERLGCLHHHDPSWPDVSDDALLTSLFTRLASQLGAVRSAGDLQNIDVHQALLALLSGEQHAQLERLVPTHFVAPSGSRIPIDYSEPDAPVAAVRLQEMFGCATTPSVLGGRVPLTLRLLSPAQRPVQVTRDLAGFWRTSYFEIRKDLRGRYPKHHWPDDPLVAVPTARAKRAR